MTRLLAVREVAATLGISKSTLHAHIAAGHIASVRIGRFTRVPETEVDRIVLEGLPKTGNPAPPVATR